MLQPKADRQIKQVIVGNGNVLLVEKQTESSGAAVIANCSNQDAEFTFPFEGAYVKVLDSADAAWGGPGSSLPNSAVAGDKHVLSGFCFAVYLKSPSKECDGVG